MEITVHSRNRYQLAHLLEHVTVELLARTNLVDEVVAGRTWRELAYDRTYSIQLACVDDVLVAAALSSAVWLMDWAFSGGVGPVPDVEATVAGLVGLVSSLPAEGESFQDAPVDDTPQDYVDADYDFADEQDDEEDLGRGPRMSRKII